MYYTYCNPCFPWFHWLDPMFLKGIRFSTWPSTEESYLASSDSWCYTPSLKRYREVPKLQRVRVAKAGEMIHRKLELWTAVGWCWLRILCQSSVIWVNESNFYLCSFPFEIWWSPIAVCYAVRKTSQAFTQRMCEDLKSATRPVICLERWGARQLRDGDFSRFQSVIVHISARPYLEGFVEGWREMCVSFQFVLLVVNGGDAPLTEELQSQRLDSN